MSHNLINNVIPGLIGLAIILGGIAWCVIADIRAQNGRPPLRLLHSLRRPATPKPVPLAPGAQAQIRPEREVISAR
jgi:hypothetical protein